MLPRNRFRSALVAATASAALIALAACSADNAAPAASSPGTSAATAAAAGSSSAATAGSVTVAYASPVASQPNKQELYAGMQQAAKSLGWKIEMLDSNLSANTQVSNIQTLIQKKASVIATWTLDSGATAGIYSQSESAGIPIVGMNSVGTGVAATVWYEASTCAAGGPSDREAAAIAKRKPGASIILITLTGVPSIDASTACFQKSAVKAGLKVLTVQSNTADNASGGSQLAAGLLAKYPDVDAFYDYNDASAEGVSSAILAAGKKIMSGTATTGIQVWGNGADSDGIAALKQGRLTGTVDSNLTESGWAVVKVMQLLLEKKPVKQITVKSSIVDSSNVGTFVDPSERSVTFATIPVASQTP
jgi:ribose transport system substrate-binding protein